MDSLLLSKPKSNEMATGYSRATSATMASVGTSSHRIYSEEGPRIALLSPQCTQHVYILRELVHRDEASRSAQGQILWVLHLLCVVALATGSYVKFCEATKGNSNCLCSLRSFLNSSDWQLLEMFSDQQLQGRFSIPDPGNFVSLLFIITSSGRPSFNM